MLMERKEEDFCSLWIEEHRANLGRAIIPLVRATRDLLSPVALEILKFQLCRRVRESLQGFSGILRISSKALMKINPFILI